MNIDEAKMEKTEKCFPYVYHKKVLIQKDRYGNWNIFVGCMFRESCANLSSAIERANNY